MAEQTASTTAANIVQGIQNKVNGKAPAAPPIKQEPPVNPTADVNAGKEKYVVEGKEVWLSPQERTAWIQKGMAFEPKMDQLARLQQETVQLQRALVNDPGMVIANLAKRSNIPVQSMVEKILSGNGSPEVKEIVGKWFYENAVMPEKSPEEFERMQKDKRLTEYEKREQAAKEQAIQQENQQRVMTELNRLKTFIGEAMKESGLPSTDTRQGAEIARRVADEIRLAKFQHREITPKQAIESVKKQLKQFQSSFYETLSSEDLVKELGEANVEKLKKHFLKVAQDLQPKIPGANGSEPRPYRKNAKIGLDEFHDYLEERKRNG